MKTRLFTLNKPDNADRPGQDDRTHFTEYGAREIAALVVAEFPRLDPKLAAVVKREAATPAAP